jgi:hypothetical protein
LAADSDGAALQPVLRNPENHRQTLAALAIGRFAAKLVRPTPANLHPETRSLALSAAGLCLDLAEDSVGFESVKAV